MFFSIKQQRIEIQKLRQGDNLILGFSIGGGIDQDPGQNPFSEDKTDKVSLCVLVLFVLLLYAVNDTIRGGWWGQNVYFYIYHNVFCDA